MPRRAFIYAHHGDTLADIAERHLAHDDQALAHLQAWNLHISTRRGHNGAAPAMMGSDIVYLEAPLP